MLFEETWWEDFSKEMLAVLSLEDKETPKKGTSRGKTSHAQVISPVEGSISRYVAHSDVENYLLNSNSSDVVINLDWSGAGALSQLGKIYKGGYTFSDTTPVIHGSYQDRDHEEPVDFLLMFKDKISSSTKTEDDEIFWAFCIVQLVNNLEHASYIKNLTSTESRKEFFEDIFDSYYDRDILNLRGKSEPIMPNDGNLQGYSKGSSEFIEGFLKRNVKYVAFRKDIFIGSDGYIQKISKDKSLHCIIETIGKEASAGADGWDPCDICICEEDKITDIINKLKEYSGQVEKATSSEEKLVAIREVNIFLQQCINEGSFITISLKKTHNPEVELINSVDEASLKLNPLPEDFALTGWSLPLAITPSDQDRLKIKYLRGLEINCSRWNRKKNLFEDVTFVYRSFDGNLSGIALDGGESEVGLKAEARLGKMPKELLSNVLIEYIGTAEKQRNSNKEDSLDTSYRAYIKDALDKISYIEQCGIKKSSKFEAALNTDRLKDYIPTVENFKKLFEKLDNQINSTSYSYRDYKHLFNLIRCIDLAYAVAKAYNSGSSEINKLLCKLYCGCGKFNSAALSGVEFAPYVKIF